MGRGGAVRNQSFSGWPTGIPASPPENNTCLSKMQNAARDHKNAFACDANGCRHREILRHTLADAIEVLEATRKSFKSKQIEALRKKLTKVLIEES